MTAEATYAPVDGYDDAEVRSDLRGVGSAWWVFLVMGIVWIFVSLMVLQEPDPLIKRSFQAPGQGVDLLLELHERLSSVLAAHGRL